MGLCFGLLAFSCDDSQSKPECRAELPTWGLPADLGEQRIESLRLPAEVAHVACLPSGLRRLSLSNSAVTSIDGLPDSIEVLDAEALKDVDWRSLPPRLTALNALWSTPAPRQLPGSLRELSVTNVTSDAIAHLPAELEYLRIASQNIEAELSPADLPRTLRRLLVEGVRFLSLVGMPPDLQEFSYRTSVVTNVSDLPEKLSTLELIGPFSAIDPSFPAYLTILRLDRLDGGPWVAWPKYLRELEVRGAVAGTPVLDVGALPRQLRKLKLTDVRLVGLDAGLPEELETFFVAGEGALPADFPLPEGLEELHLQNWGEESLPRLPDGLELLDLSWATPEELPERFPAGMKELIVAGPEVSAMLSALPASLETLRWDSEVGLPPLPSGLRTLEVCCTSGVWLDHLPENLQHLDLSGLELAALPSLPSTLLTLDIRHTGIPSIERLEEMSPELRCLAVSPGSLGSLEGLPSSVAELIFDDGSCEQTH